MSRIDVSGYREKLNDYREEIIGFIDDKKFSELSNKKPKPTDKRIYVGDYLMVMRVMLDMLDKLNKIPYLAPQAYHSYNYFHAFKPRVYNFFDGFYSSSGFSSLDAEAMPFEHELPSIVKDASMKRLEVIHHQEMPKIKHELGELYNQQIKKLTLDKFPLEPISSSIAEINFIKDELFASLPHINYKVIVECEFILPEFGASIQFCDPIKESVSFVESLEKFNGSDDRKKMRMLVSCQDVLDKRIEDFSNSLNDWIKKSGINELVSNKDAFNAVVERLITITQKNLLKLQQTIKLFEKDIEQNFQIMGLADIKLEIIKLREQFKDFIIKSKHDAVFSDASEIPFYRRIGETVMLIDKLMELHNPDLTTIGSRDAAKEQYAEIIQDEKILRKYRQDIESVELKIQNTSDDSSYCLSRIILLMQYVIREMKKLLTVDQNPLLNQGLFADVYSMLESSAATTTLSLTQG